MKRTPAKAQSRKGKPKITLCVFAPLRETLIFALLVIFAICISLDAGAQNQPPLPATLGLDQGYLDLETPAFKLRLVKASQTVAALEPKSTPGFDFTPADRLAQRAANRYHHLGDLIFRARVGNSGPWQKYDTAESRAPVESLTTTGPTLAAANLAPTLPSDTPLQVTRSWIVDNGNLVLRFDLKNKTAQPVQLGALGLPMVFNNMITGRNLKESHEKCSFSDPYIGQDAGYLQVTRLSGAGPALVVVPDGQTPFESYQLLTEPTRPSQTFEGAFAWMVHTHAFADDEWRGVVPWNPPTQATLAPGATRTYGVKFLLADGIRKIEATLAQHDRPVAIGIPGYVLPMDIEGRLFINHKRKITNLAVQPAGALEIKAQGVINTKWRAFRVRGKTWGRARLALTYDDGSTQSISYYVIKPSAQAVADLGNFLFTKQWFEDPNDPFHRSPSVMSYDRETDKIVTQDSRVWIAGLGDEGGSGSWLAAAMKQFGQPRKEEIEKYEQFIDRVLWGGLQYKVGPNRYGVRKSLFYYSPQDVPGYKYDPALDWTTWTSWKKTDAESIGRGYNYPHVIAAYWSLYRLARNHPGLVTNHSWDWYLDQAYETARFMFSRQADGRRRVGYVELGLMEGDVIVALLEDLKREAWNDKAQVVESLMKERADRWKQEPYPFGSEMAWDSTGQEEVYAWCKYFGYYDKALVSLNSIIGYMPTLPHWGYNGNARRYWDFLYGGKIRRIERQLHHYGSGLNAIPVLAHYREHPEDEYLLRIGYGGTLGALTNIDQEGFGSVAFHSFPATLKWDAYTGDYGPNFFGHAFNTATYVIDTPEFGWQSFGGNVSVSGNWVNVRPLDSFRKRVYIAPLGLWLTLDAGTFETVAINTRSSVVRVTLSQANGFTPNARLRIQQPARIASVGIYTPRQRFVNERDAFTIPLGRSTTTIDLVHKQDSK
ncbi:MAG TPA: DUF5695 domain-containing protein [Pyrinomonadaceae bacterium]|nr:DUF5695 domain-containing protein [Pyrinomonadaceae bacterium]